MRTAGLILGKTALGIDIPKGAQINAGYIFCGARSGGALDRLKYTLDEIHLRKYISTKTTNFICRYFLLHVLNLDTPKHVPKYV